MLFYRELTIRQQGAPYSALKAYGRLPYDFGQNDSTTDQERTQTMKATVSSQKSERLEARITLEQKELFQRAASLTGRSLSDFVVSSLQAAAAETIRSHQVMELTATETEAFVAAILSPPEPSAPLRAGVNLYRKLVDRK